MTFNFSKDKLPKQLFINNEYVESKNVEKLTVYNPKDGSLVADDVPLAGEADLDSAVVAAEKALPQWRNMPAAQRRGILLKFADLIEYYAEALIELTTVTLGAPVCGMGKIDLQYGVESFRYNAGWIDKFAGESFPQEDGFLKIVRNEPLGVTAGILPWNGPLATIGFKAAPALATGNCFIVKPSEKTPFVALAIGSLIIQAGFPPGVFQVLSGDGSTGALISSHMRIRKVSFTGSIATGKKVQELAARSNLKRVTLELGGKSPAVVFDDCNLDNAVMWTADALATNTGQICFAATRVYVQEGIYDKFIQQYKQRLQEHTKTIGDPDDNGTGLGPVVDEAQFKRITGFIDRGQKGQGKLLIGGKRVGDKGFFIEPTVFTDVDTTSEIHCQEIFGPVSVVKSFKTEEEVMALSNKTNFGLMAGVFTQDINKALRVACDFETGMVGINCISLLMLNAPFGGSKESGIGRECGISALRAFTEPKTIMVNLKY